MRRQRRRVPLARLNLTHDPRRLLASLCGVTFAVVLIFMELGFWNALMDSTVGLIDTLNLGNNDIVMLSRSRYMLSVRGSFSLRRLYQARDLAGVDAVYPLYIETRLSLWRNPLTRRAAAIRVLGFDPDDRVFRDHVVAGMLPLLRLPDTALIDEWSKEQEYGRPRAGMTTSLSRRPIRIVGTFRLGTDFVNDGTLIMSERNFLRYLPDRHLRQPELRRVELGIVKVRAGFDPVPIVAALRRTMGEDVQVHMKPQLVAQERRYWRDHTPTGQIFGLGLIMGFIVGVIICYQILSSDIRSHLAEYATLKAMGYGKAALARIVMDQALWLSALGFAPGLVVAAALYALVRARTGLPMSLASPDWGGFGRVALVAGVTVAMCVASGWLAIRKLFTTDPAELFK